MTSSDHPVDRFRELFDRAAAGAPFDHTAAALATATPDGEPTVRVVLVRIFDERGFIFFTNYRSQKARDIAQNPRAALCFYWPWIEEQVRIEGTLTTITPEESEMYFAARPRGSQVGAWASLQSDRLAAREELDRRYLDYEREFEGRDVPRPEHWGGYRLAPLRMEFWRNGAYRLHDRWLYTREGDAWMVTRLYP
jgi:pyridoxamine 5'-phosphate oxidase